MYYPFDKLIRPKQKTKKLGKPGGRKHAKTYQLHLQDKIKGHRLK